MTAVAAVGVGLNQSQVPGNPFISATCLSGFQVLGPSSAHLQRTNQRQSS